MKTIFFDTETTGLNSYSCQIIELSMITVIDGETIEEYDKFVRYDGLLPERIVSLTGITDKLLREEGVDEKVIAEDLKERLSEGTLMIAHNCQFDLSFIYNLLKKYYPNEAYEILESLYWIDSLTVLKDRKNYPHKLIDAADYYGIEYVNFHRGIDDTIALINVVREMRKERDDLKEYINIFGYNPKYGVQGERFRFIEYKKQYYHNRGFLPSSMILPRE